MAGRPPPPPPRAFGHWRCAGSQARRRPGVDRMFAAVRLARRVASGMFGAGRKEATSRRFLVRGFTVAIEPTAGEGFLLLIRPKGLRPMAIEAARPADISGNLSLFRRRSDRSGVSGSY